VIVAGAVLPLAPNTSTVMPGVEVISSSVDSFCAVFRSISRPTAIRGAIAGSTRAVQPVEVSPSAARLGSPKVSAG
jgi:hypothetical protein